MMHFAFKRVWVRGYDNGHATTFSFLAKDDADLLAILTRRRPLLHRDESLVALNDEALLTLLRFSARKP